MKKNKQISPHFTLGELTASDTAARKGLDNTPTPEIEAELARVAGVLELVRAIYNKPVVVSSGYRSPAVNHAVGGASNSEHVKGRAADVNVPGITPYELGRAIMAAGIPFNQLIHEFGEWVHISIPPVGVAPKLELLTIKKGTGYMPGWIK